MKKGQYVIVRSSQAGVFAGELVGETQSNGVAIAKLRNSRRLWYWSGAASLSQLAVEGVKNPSNCKFPIEVPEHTIYGVSEILAVSDAARKCIASVPIWKA